MDMESNTNWTTSGALVAMFANISDTSWSNVHNVTTTPIIPIHYDHCLVEPFLCKSGTLLFRTVANIFCSILIILILFLNLPLLFTILNLNRTRLKPAHIIILSLATADLLAACVYLPVLIVVLQRGEAIECNGVCTTLVTLEKGSIAASVWGVAFISLDRYLFIVKHSTYRSKMTSRKAYVGVVMVWTCAVLFSIVSYFLATSTRHRTGECVCHLSATNYGFFNLGFSAFYIVFCSVLPTTLMFISYVFLNRVGHVQSHFVCNNSNGRIVQPAIGRLPPNEGCDTRILDTTLLSVDANVTNETIPGESDNGWSVSTQTMPQEQVRVHTVNATRMIVVILFLFVLLTTPYFIITLVVSMGHWEPHAHPYFLHIISVLLFHTNSACNALLHGYSNRRLRDSLINYLHKKISHQKQTESDIVPSQWLPGSRLSVMGDGSSVGRGDDSSSDSDISRFSAFSKVGFISRDLLAKFRNHNSRNTRTPQSVSEVQAGTPSY